MRKGEVPVLIVLILVFIFLNPFSHLKVLASTEGVKVEIHKKVEWETRFNLLGELKLNLLNVKITLQNPADEPVETPLVDRVFRGKANTLKMLRGSKPPLSNYTIGEILYLEWRNISLPPLSRTTIEYQVETDEDPPIRFSIRVLVNGREADFLSLNGKRYLVLNKSDEVVYEVNFTNNLVLYGSGARKKPLQVILTTNFPIETFETKKTSPNPFYTDIFMGREINTWSFWLENETESVEISLDVKEDVTMGEVELEPIRVMFMVPPKETAENLEETLNDANQTISDLRNLSDVLMNYTDMLKNQTDLLNLSRNVTKKLRDALLNLSNLTVNLSDALNETAEATGNISKVIGEVEDSLNKYIFNFRSKISGMITFSASLPPPPLPPAAPPDPLNPWYIYSMQLLSYLNDLGIKLKKVAAETSTMVRNQLLKSLRPLETLRDVLSEANEYLGLINGTLLNMSNASLNFSDSLANLSNATNQTFNLLNLSFNLTNRSIEFIDDLRTEINGKVGDLEEQRKDLEEKLELLRSKSFFFLKASSKVMNGEKLHVKFKHVERDIWTVEKMSLETSSDGELNLLVVSLSGVSNFTFQVRNESTWINVEPESLGFHVKGGTITFIPQTPKHMNGNILRTMTGNEVRILFKFESKPSYSFFADYSPIENSTVEFKGNIFVEQPRISIGYKPQPYMPKQINVTGFKPSGKPLILNKWIWFPILLTPVAVVSLLALIERPPSFSFEKETEELINEIKEIEKKFASKKDSS